jgi:hypothetical protein
VNESVKTTGRSVFLVLVLLIVAWIAIELVVGLAASLFFTLLAALVVLGAVWLLAKLL